MSCFTTLLLFEIINFYSKHLFFYCSTTLDRRASPASFFCCLARWARRPVIYTQGFIYQLTPNSTTTITTTALTRLFQLANFLMSYLMFGSATFCPLAYDGSKMLVAGKDAPAWKLVTAGSMGL
jgi:hypothetical protein